MARPSPHRGPGARLDSMNGDRDARGQEVSSSDGYTRPGQVGDPHFDPVSGDGVTAPLPSTGEFPADGAQAGAPAGIPANGPAGNPANGPAGNSVNGPAGSSVNGPGGGLPGG